MEPIKISIITPVFNNEKDIGYHIDAVSKQTYQNIEHIIVDGNSTDNTLHIIKKKANEIATIKFMSAPDNGVYDAMNKGINMATGEYLYFMGSDDVFYNEKTLSEVVPKFENTDLIYANVLFKHKQIIYAGEFDKNRIIDQSICHQAAFFKHNLFEKVGRYNSNLKFAGDWDLFLRCFYHPQITIKYLDTVVCIYNEQGISGYQTENRYTKYKILLQRLGISGVLKYLSIQLRKLFR